MTTFIDTSAVIALLNADDEHHNWSVEKFNQAKENGPVIIADIVYSEVSMGLASMDATDVAIESLGLQRFANKNEALFRAGRAFLRYRDQNAGQKTNVLPDFLIGAVAEVETAPLMTSNAKDFNTYFPELDLITP